MSSTFALFLQEDNFLDERSNYVQNEVSIVNNAPLVSVLANMVMREQLSERGSVWTDLNERNPSQVM